MATDQQCYSNKTLRPLAFSAMVENGRQQLRPPIVSAADKVAGVLGRSRSLDDDITTDMRALPQTEKVSSTV